MITGLDSAYPPTPAQIAQAKAAGYGAWLGYFAGPGILNGWAEQNFHDVMSGGMATGAYCSGWADPVAMKSQQASWGVPRIILDDESGIRSVNGSPAAGELNRMLARRMMHGGAARPVLERQPDGTYQVSSWVQPWLTASGSGLYGNQPVFAGTSASCYVFAAYPGGDPMLTWPTYQARPTNGPCGWQFQGTHALFGAGVDATHFDDDFWAEGPTPGEEVMLYTSNVHSLAATLKAYAAGSYYAAPFSSLPALGGVTVGAQYAVDSYCYSNTPVQSTTPAGADFAWWHVKTGGWVPDALLVTTGVAGAPGMAWPATEPAAQLYDSSTARFLPLGGSVSMADVDNAITAAIAKLPAYATQDQVLTEIGNALAQFKPTSALPTPHHHSVLGVISTGPAIPDPA